MSISMDPGVWLSSIIILGIYSYLLFGDNILFAIGENLTIGAITAHSFVIAIRYIIDNSLIPISSGNILRLLPTIIGLLLFARFSREYSWLTGFPVAMIVGVGAGVSLRAVVRANLIGQLSGVLNPLWVQDSIIDSFNNIVLVIGTLGVLVYYIFTKEHTGILKVPAKIGRIYLMILFGATFGAGFVGSLTQVISSWLIILSQLLGLA